VTMRERFTRLLHRITPLQVIGVIALCFLISFAFALGATMGRVPRPLPPAPPSSEQNPPPLPRGTFGAIDQIQGNVIRVRDSRSGRVWSVHTGDDTVIQLGERRRVPLNDLRPGQRVFIVGSRAEDGFDAQFIGVVLGQSQRFIMPTRPRLCLDCQD
jgi:hypothetical protein